MVVGRLVNTNEKLYDYAAVLWPEGVVDTDADNLYLFDKSDVDNLYFCGFACEEENRYCDYLSRQMKLHKSNGTL